MRDHSPGPSGVAARLPAILWSVLLAVLLTWRGDAMPPEPEGLEWIDKPIHALLFAVHYLLLARALAGRRAAAAAAAASALYAVALEAVQILVPGRAWEWWDVAADLAGIALAALLAGRARARLPGA